MDIPQRQLRDAMRIQGMDAPGLLKSRNPNAARRFRRLVASLNTLLEDIRKDFPDANYYAASYKLHLMLGPPHTDEKRTGDNQDYVAVEKEMPSLDGGDW